MPSALPIKCEDYVSVQKYLETRIDALENIYFSCSGNLAQVTIHIMGYWL